MSVTGDNLNGTFVFNLLVRNELVLPRLTQRGAKFFHKKVESFQEVSGDVELEQSRHSPVLAWRRNMQQACGCPLAQPGQGQQREYAR